MMDDVLDELLARLASEPMDRLVVLGRAPDGVELRSGWHEDHADAASECVSVYVEVPRSAGRLFVVLCRWSDEGEALVYSSVQGGMDLPTWRSLDLLPDGVRLSVRLAREEEPRVYDFRWTTPLVLPPRPT